MPPKPGHSNHARRPPNLGAVHAMRIACVGSVRRGARTKSGASPLLGRLVSSSNSRRPFAAADTTSRAISLVPRTSSQICSSAIGRPSDSSTVRSTSRDRVARPQVPPTTHLRSTRRARSPKKSAAGHFAKCLGAHPRQHSRKLIISRTQQASHQVRVAHISPNHFYQNRLGAVPPRRECSADPQTPSITLRCDHM